jgi:hypothetical protein
MPLVLVELYCNCAVSVLVVEHCKNPVDVVAFTQSTTTSTFSVVVLLFKSQMYVSAPFCGFV